jgi:hypothetical protein
MHFRNLSVRYVGTTVIGGVVLLNDILKNGVTNMGCGALVYQIQRTSTKSHQLRCAFLQFNFHADSQSSISHKCINHFHRFILVCFCGHGSFNIRCWLPPDPSQLQTEII